MENKIISAFKNNKLLLNIDTNKLNFSDVKGKLLTLKEGQLVFKQGDSSDYLYLIINGTVRVVENEDAIVKNSVFLTEGDFFGHADLYESIVRKTTAIASTDSYVIAVTKAELNFLLWQDPNILINLKTYCQFPAIIKETLPVDNLQDTAKEESEINVNVDNDVLITDEFNITLDEPDINFDNLKIEEDVNTTLISEETEFKFPDNLENDENEAVVEIEPLVDEPVQLPIDLSQLPEFIDDEEPENIEFKFSDDLSLGSFRTTTFYEDNNANIEPPLQIKDEIPETKADLSEFNLDFNNTDENEIKIESSDFEPELSNIEKTFDLSEEETKIDEDLLSILPKDDEKFEFNIPISEETLENNEIIKFGDDISIENNEEIIFNEDISFSESEKLNEEEPKEEFTFNFDFVENKSEEPVISNIKLDDESKENEDSLVEQYLKQFESTENENKVTEEHSLDNFELKFDDDEIIKAEGELKENDDFDKNEFLKNEFDEFNLEHKNTEDDLNVNEFNLQEEAEEDIIINEPITEELSVDETIPKQDVEELRKQGVMNIEQLQMILKAAQLVSSKIKLDDVLQNIVSVATNITKADRGTLYLVDKEKGEIWSKVVMGNELKEIRLKIGDGIAGWVAKTGEIVNIKDVQNDSRFKASFDKSSGYQTKTMICFPICNAEGEIIGVHQLLNSANGEFTQLDETFLNAISIHAAIALENAELVEKLLQFERISSLGKMANFLIQDIKNPILISKRYAEHLKTKHLQADSDKVVDMILEQLNQVADLVLTTSNYSEKNKVLRQINTNLISVLNDYNSRLEQVVKKKNCNIVTKFDIDVLVRVDLKEFFQAYQHVIKNAADSMTDGGTITVTTKKEPGFVKIFIADTGVGIPDNVKEKIFDPFMSYGKKEGTGLGLSIAKKIVNEHSGDITFESVIDQGSTFVIKLPIAQDF